ncbi:MFS transporter [Bacillus badius]|uniref:Major facilitator superfamily MFS_1 n=1 Tax=Bacillus badius TaxID=1455 RepID=A0ABR5AXD3_BACBA|nr:MFS transporter [Bacillus badius]KIL79400.1 major facilitator superfamily MFS_1 [Bacillus badius]MED4716578.1 MFS transporter [Bacillus badius]
MESLAAESKHVTAERKYGLLTAVFFCSGLFIVSALFVTIPLHPLFAADFQLTAERAALASSICSFCYAFGTVCFAPLSDRYGRKRMILLGMISLIIVSPVIGLLKSYEAILLVRGLQGFVAASFAPTALTFITELYPQRKRATAIGFISAGFLMAGIIGQVYSSTVAALFGWNFVFYILGPVYAFAALAFYVVIPQDSAYASEGRRSIIGAFAVVLSQRFFRFCYFITALLLLSFVGMYTILESYLQETYALEAVHILLVRSAGILGMLLAPFGGRLVSRFGVLPLMRTGLALAALGLSCIGIFENILLITLMSVIFTAGISVTVPALVSLLGQSGGDEKSSAMSLYSFFLFIGSTLGPVMAVVFMKTGSHLFAFTIMSAFLAVGFLTTFPLAKQAAT